jgi:hypothetical protein
LFTDNIFDARNGKRTGGLDDGPRVFEDVLDAGADFVGVDQHDLVDVLAAQTEGFLPDATHRNTVGKCSHSLERHALLFAQRIVHGRGIDRLDADDPDARVQVLGIDSDAGDESAATHRHEDGVDLAARLAKDLHGHRALPRDHIRIVEGMHEREIALAHDGLRVFVGAVVIVAMQDHFATQVARRSP